MKRVVSAPYSAQTGCCCCCSPPVLQWAKGAEPSRLGFPQPLPIGTNHGWPAAAQVVGTGAWPSGSLQGQPVCLGPLAAEWAGTASPTQLKIEEIDVAAAGIPEAMVYVCDTLPPAAPPGALAKGCKFLTAQRIWDREQVFGLFLRRSATSKL